MARRTPKKENELWVGFYKRASGKPSITWPESVDEALCFGWIDGLGKSVDDISYTIRFTPRRSGSTWSQVEQRRSAKLSPAFQRRFEANADAWRFFTDLAPGYQRRRLGRS